MDGAALARFNDRCKPPRHPRRRWVYSRACRSAAQRPRAPRSGRPERRRPPDPLRAGLISQCTAIGAFLSGAFAPWRKDRGSASSKLPWTRFDREDSPHKIFGATRFPLTELTSLRSLVPGATLNDVMLAIVGGGLRCYLSGHHELPRQPLVACVPVNVRSKGEQSSGNHLSVMTVSLHTDIEDPVFRLRAIHDEMRVNKSGQGSASAKLVAALTQNVPAFGQHLIRRVMLQGPLRIHLCNLFVSNVPGPTTHRYFADGRVEHIYSLAPLGSGMGLFIGTPSYAGEVTLNVVSSKEMMPDVEIFVGCLREAWDALARRVA